MILNIKYATIFCIIVTRYGRYMLGMLKAFHVHSDDELPNMNMNRKQLNRRQQDSRSVRLLTIE